MREFTSTTTSFWIGQPSRDYSGKPVRSTHDFAQFQAADDSIWVDADRDHRYAV